MRKSITLLAAYAVLLSACASVGKPFDIAKADELQPGISTESDAKNLLGDPVSIDINPQNQHQLLIWQYTHATALTGARASILAVSFDANGKMIAVVHQEHI